MDSRIESNSIRVDQKRRDEVSFFDSIRELDLYIEEELMVNLGFSIKDLTQYQWLRR